MPITIKWEKDDGEGLIEHVNSSVYYHKLESDEQADRYNYLAWRSNPDMCWWVSKKGDLYAFKKTDPKGEFDKICHGKPGGKAIRSNSAYSMVASDLRVWVITRNLEFWELSYQNKGGVAWNWMSHKLPQIGYGKKIEEVNMYASTGDSRGLKDTWNWYEDYTNQLDVLINDYPYKYVYAGSGRMPSWRWIEE